MTYPQAQNLLDQCRAGANIPEAVITKALKITGDLEFDDLDLALAELAAA